MPVNKFSGILLDSQYKVNESGEASIQLYVSGEKEIRVFEDTQFRPYFYIIANDSANTIKELEKADFGEGIKVLKVEKAEKEGIRNALKVFFKNPQDLVKARETIGNISGVIEKREYDIPFANRYLIDNKLTPMQGVEIEEENGAIKKVLTKKIEHEIRSMAIDLETYSPGRFSDPNKDPILMAVLSTKHWSKVYTYKKSTLKNTVIVKDEKELVEKIIEEMKNFQPDLLVTYNGDSFDLPYIKTRCEKLKINFNIGFGGIRIVKRGLYNSASMKGTQHLDAFQLVKFMARIGAVSLLKFDLENVSEKLFDKPKEKVKAEDINKLWDAGTIDRVIEYNREDGDVTLRLAEEFLPLQLQLASMLRQTIFDTSRASSSQMVEQLLIIKSFEKNFLAPNKPSEGETKQRTLQTYEGGFVKEPLPGLHENIAVLDFRSLHPTIMISHNISPETLKCDHAECKVGKNLSPDKDWFCEKKKGFLAGILEEILANRIEIKEKMKSLEKKSHEYKSLNARQHALKILLNSHYGYLGYARARWYSRESARAVTAWSRHYIRDTMRKAEEKGYTALYSDTDSCFLLMPKDQGEKEAKEFAKSVNEDLPGAMELEFEGLFKRGIFVTKKEGGAAKKRYALIDFQNNLKIVGFEYVRRDWSWVAKNTQREVIQNVLEEGKPEKAIIFVRKVINEVKSGKVPKKDLVIMTQLKRKPENYDSIGPHVAAAKKAIERGKDIDVGSVLGFIVTKNGKSISDRAELEEYVAEGNYDADYYITHQIIPAVIKIMRELGYSEEDLMHGGKQSSLSSFV
ncbi:MAG TPA: DNA-directed DNA polymerase [archaeon]|nr:DNA-directed DNA polymerase [archaeon]